MDGWRRFKILGKGALSNWDLNFEVSSDDARRLEEIFGKDKQQAHAAHTRHLEQLIKEEDKAKEKEQQQDEFQKAVISLATKMKNEL